jgi:ankyrin repeat protein
LNAVKTGNIAVVEMLMREDSSLARARDDSGVSALLLAQYSNQSDVVTRLLTDKSKLDVFEAAALGLNARLAALLDADASLLTAWSAHGFTPLHLAAHVGQVDAVRLLLKHGAPIDARSQNWLGVTRCRAQPPGDTCQLWNRF